MTMEFILSTKTQSVLLASTKGCWVQETFWEGKTWTWKVTTMFFAKTVEKTVEHLFLECRFAKNLLEPPRISLQDGGGA